MINSTLKKSFFALCLMLVQSVSAVTITLNINNNNSGGALFTSPVVAQAGDVIRFTNNLAYAITNSSSPVNMDIVFSPALPGSPASIASGAFFSYTVTAASPTSIYFIHDNMTVNLYYNNKINISTVSAVNEVASDIAVYPNPAKNVVNVSEQGTIELLNLKGQVLQTVKAISEVTKIDLSNTVNGVYLIRAQGSGAFKPVKLNVIK